MQKLQLVYNMYICFRLCRGAYKLKRTFKTHFKSIVVLISKRKWARKKKPFVQQPFWVSHYGKMPYNCFIRLRGKPSIWNKLVAALSYFFLMKSWQLGSAFLMWFCTLCVSIYLIVFFSCQWVHMYTYPKKKIHYLVVVKNNCLPLPILGI